MPLRFALSLLLLGWVGPAIAQSVEPASTTDIIRLSSDQREAALEAGAERASRELPINGLTRGVHGEIGTEFGSRGERALYGAASVPLGDTGSASFSFMTDRVGRWRGH